MKSKKEQSPLLSFVAFLKTKPADEHYDWNDPSKCPCAQFRRFVAGVSYGWLDIVKEIRKDEAIDINQLALGPVDIAYFREPYMPRPEHTFGALLHRVQEAMA